VRDTIGTEAWSREVVVITCPNPDHKRKTKRIGTIRHVRDYSQPRSVGTDEGLVDRPIHMDDGYVLRTTWHDSQTPPGQRAPQHEVDQPLVLDSGGFVTCERHGYMRWISAEQARTWVEEAPRKPGGVLWVPADLQEP
jgi:hypothetical protein